VRLSTPSLLFAVITAGIALAQDPSGVQGKIKHVIVVIQENRTTDNLFGSNPRFETGVNISPQAGLPLNCSTYTMPLAAQPLYTTWDIGHSYEDFQDMWNGGAMNGAWDENYNLGVATSCDGSQGIPQPYAYADNTPNSTYPYGEVAPYFWIAQEWGIRKLYVSDKPRPQLPSPPVLVLRNLSTGHRRR
jgi:hypothetical protein